MDCYFRQYWRDSRLSFKGLKMNSNQLLINQLSLNVKMLGKFHNQSRTKSVFPDRFFFQKRFGSLTHISIMDSTLTSTRSRAQTSSSEYQKMGTLRILWGALRTSWHSNSGLLKMNQTVFWTENRKFLAVSKVLLSGAGVWINNCWPFSSLNQNVSLPQTKCITATAIMTFVDDLNTILWHE